MLQTKTKMNLTEYIGLVALIFLVFAFVMIFSNELKQEMNEQNSQFTNGRSDVAVSKTSEEPIDKISKSADSGKSDLPKKKPAAYKEHLKKFSFKKVGISLAEGVGIHSSASVNGFASVKKSFSYTSDIGNPYILEVSMAFRSALVQQGARNLGDFVLSGSVQAVYHYKNQSPIEGETVPLIASQGLAVDAITLTPNSQIILPERVPETIDLKISIFSLLKTESGIVPTLSNLKPEIIRVFGEEPSD